MPITAMKSGENATMKILGTICTPLAAGSVPLATLKGATNITVEIDASITNASASLTLFNFLRRIKPSLIVIKNAKALAFFVASSGSAIAIDDAGIVQLSGLPKEADDWTRKAILARLTKRLRLSEDLIASWFAAERAFKSAEVKELFGQSNLSRSDDLLTSDGKWLDVAKVYARYNAASKTQIVDKKRA